MSCHVLELLIVEDFCFIQHLPLQRFQYKPSLTLRASLQTLSCTEHNVDKVTFCVKYSFWRIQRLII